MIVTVKSTELTMFSDIKAGEPFVQDDTAYIKLHETCDTFPFNAVDLKTGNVTAIPTTTVVSKAFGTINLEVI